jgi:hypothetical protein
MLRFQAELAMQLKTRSSACINLRTNTVVVNSSDPGSNPPPRSATIIAAGLLLAALSLVVLYTERGAFLSPVALVVIAAIGVAALLLQLRLRTDISPSVRVSTRATLWLNALGVLFSVGAVLADVFHPRASVILIASLVAVGCFSISGIIVLKALRKPRI